MRPLAVIVGLACGLAVPMLLLGLTLCLLSLVDVAAQTVGVGTE